ncbi:ThiF family adenylyltransferase [Burkholderia cepacia]|uniref:ThiF family adenylyltransferase n=1 Tax=Burkholderia cepacia TaxID=292 RepID=UPI001ABA1B5D|nr:ThiF family adenylyltransferase [Burkholderia cepacia]
MPNRPLTTPPERAAATAQFRATDSRRSTMKRPPLVAELAPLSADELTCYRRHILLPEIGLVGQQRLKSARVPAVGAGGLGSPALRDFAAAGIGMLGVIDSLGSTYPGLLQRLVERDRPYRFVNAYVNDDDVRLKGGLSTAIADGDTITILPAVAGGRH